MTSFRIIFGQSWNSEISAILPYEIWFQSFNFDLKFCWNWSFFHYEKIIDLKKVLSYLELGGQGRGIIMGVTRPFLLGPFYYVSSYVTPNLSTASVAHTSIFWLFMKGNLTLIQSLVTLRMCCGSYVDTKSKYYLLIVDVFTFDFWHYINQTW